MLNDIYHIYSQDKKYKILSEIKLNIIHKDQLLTKFLTKGNECEGFCIYDILFNFRHDTTKKKNRTCDIKVTSINVIDQDQFDIVLTLIHEMAHALSPHYERKINGEYIHIEHSHLFYDKFLELLNFAYDNKIVNKKYDLKQLKIDDKK